MKLQEDSRQEFVSNVSHELKTPITSMKVLADSLLAQDEVPAELYKEFMGDIAEEIDRENKIITDLLSLVKMDRKSSDVLIGCVGGQTQISARALDGGKRETAGVGDDHLRQLCVREGSLAYIIFVI